MNIWSEIDTEEIICATTVQIASCALTYLIVKVCNMYRRTKSILLNNLVHVHNELENYFESQFCITCLYDLIAWKSSQQTGRRQCQRFNGQ
jgi:hypothetical protein